MVPDGVVDFDQRGPLTRGFLEGLGSLVRGDHDAAARAAARMGDAAPDPKVPPDELDAHVDEIIAAAAAGDEAELVAAVERRSAWLAKEFGASIENRRDRSGVLDLPGTAVVACAVRSGLRPEVGTDYVAVELVGGGLMGYTLELWALPVAGLEAELARPTLDPALAADDDTLPDGLAERWPDLARQVSDVIASGGGEIAGTLSVYVHAVVRSMGTHYGALDHTSNEGEEFRRWFLPGPAADRFGRRPARPHPARWPVPTSAPCGRSSEPSAGRWTGPRPGGCVRLTRRRQRSFERPRGRQPRVGARRARSTSCARCRTRRPLVSRRGSGPKPRAGVHGGPALRDKGSVFNRR